MAWTKTIPVEATVNNDNIKMTWYLSDQPGTVRERIYAKVAIRTDLAGADTIVQRVQANTVLSGEQLDGIVASMQLVRNQALADAGFTES